jgi:hypothetical protein
VRVALKVAFEKALIPIEKPEDFAELQSAIERVFRPQSTRKFLMRIAGRSIRIRDFDGVLAQQCIEHVDSGLQQAGKTAKGIYDGLPLADQAQMREFYLSKLEQVDKETRYKFKKLYQYY